MPTRDSRLQPAHRNPREPRHLLDRILETPQLAQAVPKLPPELLHRVIEHYGLEACGELVSLTTHAQLTHLLDLDLWRSAQAGRDVQFDAARFGEWIDVLVNTSADVAAARLATMDAELVIAGLSRHIRVFDPGSTAPYMTLDGIQITPISLDDETTREVGGYLLAARRSESWGPIVEALLALESGHSAAFHRVMQGCRALSNSGHEIDALRNLLESGDQAMFDLEIDRECRREQQGYLTPAQARAFLQSARQVPRGPGTSSPSHPIVRAYFRALEDASAEAAAEIETSPSSAVIETTVRDDAAAAVAEVVDLLADAGVLPHRPRALLDAADGRESSAASLEAQLQAAHEHDPATGSMRSEELAFLANAVMAGCSIQGRAFTRQEASDAVMATCNLGLENWPHEWAPEGRSGSAGVGCTGLPGDFFIENDLVVVFQVGWTVLHERVSMFTAERLIEVLTAIRCSEVETQRGLIVLRQQLARAWRAGTPWQARDALDVITNLDLPAWAGLLALIDECPSLHAAVTAAETGALSVAPDAFEFISSNRQIDTVRRFMTSLPARLV